MSRVYLVVTAVGHDKRGTVEKITDIIVAHHANIEESKMARLGGEFAVIMLLSLSDQNVESIINGFDNLQTQGLTITSRKTDFSRLQKFKGYVPYEISVIGADHEGIVNSVASYLASEQINIEEMDTTVTNAPNTGTPLFAMSARVQAPPDLSLSQLRKKLAKVGDELDVDIEVKVPVS
ncbi:MAG: ACT domain-containing protein [Desulfobacterales bacterium]|jgi:glycine cleavage system transcriptional repressor